ncbi:hypothetical protein BCR35DRAFT_99577 [Leucosporidium creatinivorum]|uniref:Uncharacterized protein n=1 Tax=Leucosporidium creatinivorum TaxID=106004 RepID=A0A1Y2F5C6_9BASI|nr:hypothetical protein BCR35DRAFT_99577 [Leucosporidium creatinivorum]
MATFHSLPPELLPLILYHASQPYFRSRQTLLRTSLVCRDWRAPSQVLLWEDLDCRAWRKCLQTAERMEGEVVDGVQRRRKARRMWLARPEFLGRIVERLEVKELRMLEGGSNVLFEVPERLLADLNSLTIHARLSPYITLPLSPIPLTHLSLTSRYPPSASVLAALLSSSPSLISLSLVWVPSRLPIFNYQAQHPNRQVSPSNPFPLDYLPLLLELAPRLRTLELISPPPCLPHRLATDDWEIPQLLLFAATKLDELRLSRVTPRRLSQLLDHLSSPPRTLSTLLHLPPTRALAKRSIVFTHLPEPEVQRTLDDEPPRPFEDGRGVTDDLLDMLDHPSLLGGLEKWEISFEGRGWVEEVERWVVAESRRLGEGQGGVAMERGESAGLWDTLVGGASERGVAMERVRKFGWDLAAGC